MHEAIIKKFGKNTPFAKCTKKSSRDVDLAESLVYLFIIIFIITLIIFLLSFTFIIFYYSFITYDIFINTYHLSITGISSYHYEREPKKCWRLV